MEIKRLFTLPGLTLLFLCYTVMLVLLTVGLLLIEAGLAMKRKHDELYATFNLKRHG